MLKATPLTTSAIPPPPPPPPQGAHARKWQKTTDNEAHVQFGQNEILPTELTHPHRDLTAGTGDTGERRQTGVVFLEGA